MNTTTYLYEVSFKKNGELTYDYVRASSKEDAFRVAASLFGDITPVSASRYGN